MNVAIASAGTINSTTRRSLMWSTIRPMYGKVSALLSVASI